MKILWLGEPACHNLSLVGGKVANLSCLAADHCVPSGFCLTTAAFDLAMESGLALDDKDSAAQNLPSAIYDELAKAYQMLADHCGVADLSVAVRSSAVDEDSSSASFAGQHKTYLNVVGVENVTKAILHCWMSARSPRTIEYRRHQGLAIDKIQVAVLIQQLIAADVSAVLFSANPVTGNQNEVVINASWGLGESIVAGTVTPDTYVVRKSDLALVSKQIAEKKRMTIPIQRGGIREVNVPRFLRTQSVLDDGQAAEMAQLGLTLEATMGWPVDVECAYHSSKLYFLQCRPITTIKTIKTIKGVS